MAMDCTPQRRPWVAALVGFAGLVAAAESRAAALNYQYGGVITRADAGTGVAAGTRFAGSFGYDPGQAPGTTSAVAGGTQYQYGQTLDGSAVADSTTLTAAVGPQAVFAQAGGLSMTVLGPGALGTDSGSPMTYLALGGTDGTTSVQLTFLNDESAVYSALNPPAKIDLADFTAAHFEVVQANGRGSSRILYEGTIDTLITPDASTTATPTPEPSTLLVLGTAAGGYALRNRHRRRAARRV